MTVGRVSAEYHSPSFGTNLVRASSTSAPSTPAAPQSDHAVPGLTRLATPPVVSFATSCTRSPCRSNWLANRRDVEPAVGRRQERRLRHGLARDGHRRLLRSLAVVPAQVYPRGQSESTEQARAYAVRAAQSVAPSANGRIQTEGCMRIDGLHEGMRRPHASCRGDSIPVRAAAVPGLISPVAYHPVVSQFSMAIAGISIHDHVP